MKGEEQVQGADARWGLITMMQSHDQVRRLCRMQAWQPASLTAVLPAAGAGGAACRQSSTTSGMSTKGERLRSAVYTSKWNCKQARQWLYAGLTAIRSAYAQSGTHHEPPRSRWRRSTPQARPEMPALFDCEWGKGVAQALSREVREGLRDRECCLADSRHEKLMWSRGRLPFSPGG